MSAARQLDCIDAHHHLWRYKADEYPWMSEKMTALRRDFLLSDLEQTVSAAGVTGTVAVQARQTVEETEWLAELASHSDLIRGVVGWAPLAEPGVGAILEKLAQLQKVRAMRHVLHDEPDNFYILRSDFNRGVALLKQFDLVYDLLIFEHHLLQTIRFVDRHPQQRFVLDHIGKPRIRSRAISPWRENLRELARRENVYCKISGMVTEADWNAWTAEDLRVYFETVIGIFGPSRLMFGSDWPVLTLASSYSRWIRCAREAIESLSLDEQRQILSGTAIDAYQLDEK
jgi:L-fuconolactonase